MSWEFQISCTCLFFFKNCQADELLRENYIYKYGNQNAYSKFAVVFKIFLTITVTSVSNERSLSKSY